LRQNANKSAKTGLKAATGDFFVKIFAQNLHKQKKRCNFAADLGQFCSGKHSTELIEIDATRQNT